MNALSHLRSRPRMLLIVLIGLVAGHAILFYLLRHSSMSLRALPSAVVAGVVLLIIAKHLRLLGALLRCLYALLRSRSQG